MDRLGRFDICVLDASAALCPALRTCTISFKVYELLLQYFTCFVAFLS